MALLRSFMYEKKPCNRRFSLSDPKVGLNRIPMGGVNKVGIVLKDAGGNFVRTFEISSQLDY